MLKLLRWLEVLLFGRPRDPAWKPQTPEPKFTGYDPVLASRAWWRARGKHAKARHHFEEMTFTTDPWITYRCTRCGATQDMTGECPGKEP